jgi:hypothetical protein
MVSETAIGIDRNVDGEISDTTDTAANDTFNGTEANYDTE